MKENSLESAFLNYNKVMEVKMFVSNDPQSAEQDISQWLAQNNIRVQHIGQSQCERNGRLMITISLFYYSNREM